VDVEVKLQVGVAQQLSVKPLTPEEIKKDWMV